MTPLPLLALLVLGFISVGATAPLAGSGEAAAPSPSLTIRNRVCPVGFTGADYFQACTEPVANMEFELTAPISVFARTDVTGVITFAELPSGTHEVTGGPPGEFVQNAIACRLTYDPTTARPYLPRDNRSIAVTLVESDITCDWYSIPEDLRGNG